MFISELRFRNLSVKGLIPKLLVWGYSTRPRLPEIACERKSQRRRVHAPWADKARATPTTRRASKKNPIVGHGDSSAARRPQALARLPLPPAPPAALPSPLPAALPSPAPWRGGGVHGAGPELAGGHPGAHRRGPPRGGPRGAHPERRRRRRRRHRRLRRVPPPRQQEVHRHGLPGLLRLQRPPRQGGRPLLRSALLLAGRHWRRAAENRGDPGRRGPAPHVQRHRVRGGDLPRDDEASKGETGQVQEPGAGDTDGGAGGEGPGGHLRVLLRAGHGGAQGREASVHDAQRGVPVGGEAGGGEDGVHHGQAGGLRREEGPRREGRVQGGGAEAAQGPRVPPAEQAGFHMRRALIFGR